MRAISMLSALCLFTVLSACDVGSGVGYGDDGRLSTQEAMRNFSEVVGRVEPVAEQECRKDAPQLNCDFLIQLDKRRSAPENAYQSLDENGRPVITFTLALITGTENADELAFVLSHEAAHHIRDHLARQRRQRPEAGRGGRRADLLQGIRAGGRRTRHHHRLSRGLQSPDRRELLHPHPRPGRPLPRDPSAQRRAHRHGQADGTAVGLLSASLSA